MDTGTPAGMICALPEGERGELRRMAEQVKHVVTGAALTFATQDTATFAPLVHIYARCSAGPR